MIETVTICYVLDLRCLTYELLRRSLLNHVLTDSTLFLCPAMIAMREQIDSGAYLDSGCLGLERDWA